MILVIGQGLAGTLLALELRKAGVCCRVAEGGLGGSGSAVAAGILSPVTGKRLAKSWRWERFRECAEKVYREWETLLEVELFRDTRVLRLFQNEQERSLWKKKKSLPEYAGLLGESYAPGEAGPGLRDDFGSFKILQAGVLEVQELIGSARKLLEEEGAYIPQSFSPDELEVQAGSVEWNGQQFETVIFCEGFRIQDNPWFEWVPMEPARGEIQKVRADAGLPPGILNRGKWMRPAGNGIYHAGSTHSWDHLEADPDEEDRQELAEGLGAIVDGSPEVQERKTGVRPATKDRRPVAGFHPDFPCLGILNGLGAKGSLMGPWMARHLTSALLKGTPIDPEVDVQRFLSRP